jgi:hypothetical protein
MARISAIRKGLKDRLALIEGLHPYATMPAKPESPAAAVIPRSKTALSFDEDATYRLSVWVYVNPSDISRAQTQIDDYLSDEGPKSIEAAIEADPTLGGVAESTSVTGWSDYAQLVTIGDGQLLGARIDVEVMA